MPDFRPLGSFSPLLRSLSLALPPLSAPILLRTIPSPWGPLLAGAVDEGLCLLEFEGRKALERQLSTLSRLQGAGFACGTSAHLEHVEHELLLYFAGQLKTFSVPLVLPGTPFQQRVWAELLRIPHGQTISYGELATRLGQPTAARAVAGANSRNRVGILVPCHRVIGMGGGLGGYGGGLPRKQGLLQLEGALHP